MRYLNLLLCTLMLVFIAVQYNDPDGLSWMLIYSVPAIWCAIAAFRRSWLRQPVPRALLLASLAAAVAGMVLFWPSTPHWWASEVWYDTETAREGMGMMIVVAVLCIVWISGRRRVAPDA
ncbi:MAG: hypothetical protein HKN42_13625 [Granulosicoccus sp.]|nr:hypothetical protein [Granulosicoccus sp.]